MKIAEAHARVVEGFPYAIKTAEQSIACYEDRIRELRAFITIAHQCMAEERLPRNEREAATFVTGGKSRTDPDALRTAMKRAEEEEPAAAGVPEPAKIPSIFRDVVTGPALTTAAG